MRYEGLFLALIGHLLSSQGGPKTYEPARPEGRILNISCVTPELQVECHCECTGVYRFTLVVSSLILCCLLGGTIVWTLLTYRPVQKDFDLGPSPRRRRHGVLVNTGAGGHLGCLLQ